LLINTFKTYTFSLTREQDAQSTYCALTVTVALNNYFSLLSFPLFVVSYPLVTNYRRPTWMATAFLAAFHIVLSHKYCGK